MRITNPNTVRDCLGCGNPTVQAEVHGKPARVHCGTYTPECATPSSTAARH
jgi:hypothetical protein